MFFKKTIQIKLVTMDSEEQTYTEALSSSYPFAVYVFKFKKW